MDHHHYSTTYGDTIGNIQPDKHPGQHLKKEKNRVKFDQSPVAAVITPNIFTQYGLSFDDLLKPRSKETILSIIEKIENFPKEMFDSIWEEGVKIDGTGGLSVLTFKTLFDKYTIEMDENDSIEIFPTHHL